jgi:hypothetical protein
MIPKKPLMCLCGVLVAACFMSDQVMAQIKKVDGYDGYKFGMTIDQALKVKSAAKQKTPCDYQGVPVCLEYATTSASRRTTRNNSFMFSLALHIADQSSCSIRNQSRGGFSHAINGSTGR